MGPDRDGENDQALLPHSLIAKKFKKTDMQTAEYFFGPGGPKKQPRPPDAGKGVVVVLDISNKLLMSNQTLCLSA